jgi:Mn-containing catalase
VNKFFNDSTGEGDNGEKDYRGPWNEDGVEFIEAPAQAIASVSAQSITREVFNGSRHSAYRANSDRKIRNR